MGIKESKDRFTPLILVSEGENNFILKSDKFSNIQNSISNELDILYCSSKPKQTAINELTRPLTGVHAHF